MGAAMRAPKERLRSREPIAYIAILVLAISLLSVSGCTGLTQASSASTKSPSSSSPNTAAASSSSLSANQTSLNFSSVDVGAKSVLSVVFTNSGNSEATISNVTVAGAGYNASGVQSGQILAPSQTATLNVTFEPAGTGPLSGSVTVTSNAANSPEKITLAGTGVQPTTHSATLRWTPSTSTVSGYNLYRSAVSGGPYAKLNEESASATSATDTGLAAGQTYYYVLTSIESGVESAYSSEVSAKIPDE